MVPIAEYPIRSKEIAIWALAQQNPEFAAFCAKYQKEITLTTPLPADFVNDVIEAVEQDSSLAPMAKRYLEKTQTAITFAVPGLPEASVLIAALFLLSTHIRFHRTEEGKWEFLVEHQAADHSTLEKIVQALSDIFKK